MTANGVIYVVANLDYFYGLNAVTGKIVWLGSRIGIVSGGPIVILSLQMTGLSQFLL